MFAAFGLEDLGTRDKSAFSFLGQIIFLDPVPCPHHVASAQPRRCGEPLWLCGFCGRSVPE